MCRWIDPSRWYIIPKTGEINSEQIDCKPVTGESIPGVDCIGKVVELGSTEVYGKWPQQTYTFGIALLLGLNIASQGVQILATRSPSV